MVPWCRGTSMVLIMAGAAGVGCAVTTPAEELQLSPDREVHVLFTGGALRAVDLTLRNATSVKLEFRGVPPPARRGNANTPPIGVGGHAAPCWCL
jgi:hypothetical protein